MVTSGGLYRNLTTQRLLKRVNSMSLVVNSCQSLFEGT